MRKLQAAIVCGSLASLAFLAACGSSDESPALTDSSAQLIGGALAAQVTAIPSSFTALDFSAGNVGGGFFAPPAMSIARWAAPSIAGGNFLAPCPAADDLTDADQDGIPDDVTYTFVQADCTNGSLYASGSIHISDLAAPDIGYTGTFNNFLIHFTGTGNDFAQIKLNGSHSVSGDATSATLAENLTTTLSGQSGTTTIQGSLHNNWTLSFDAAQGQNIVMDDLLPSGAFNLQGNFTYDVQGERHVFTIQTVTPLAYDSACNGEAHPFTGGQLRAHVGGPNGNVYVQVTYTGCGVEPDVVLVGRNS